MLNQTTLRPSWVWLKFLSCKVTLKVPSKCYRKVSPMCIRHIASNLIADPAFLG